MIPPLPSHRGNISQHSFVWTNYWEDLDQPSNETQKVNQGNNDDIDDVTQQTSKLVVTNENEVEGIVMVQTKEEVSRELGIEEEGCVGEDRERQYFHCATIWRPLRESLVVAVKLELGAARILMGREEEYPLPASATDSEVDEDEHGIPNGFFEPQVIVLVTKVPYHESFSAALRAFVQVDSFPLLLIF